MHFTELSVYVVLAPEVRFSQVDIVG